mmetsp:Transcript_9810/g.9626  ORF Transcript_9810/g.9626 Transcript_9810/m.9626 type:complete len:137 (-) Transcript_9810:1019-1429(-)
MYNYLVMYGDVMCEHHFQSSVEAGLIPIVLNPDNAKVAEASEAINYLLNQLSVLIAQRRTQYIHTGFLELVYNEYHSKVIHVSDDSIMEDSEVVVYDNSQHSVEQAAYLAHNLCDNGTVSYEQVMDNFYAKYGSEL